ncbi:MAG TPA: DAK2 domain-containing protein [Dehalococcoidales bacterium]
MEEALYDGQDLKQAYKSAELVLEKRIDEVNALNVFPVPDGDTGINMYLTFQSANEAVKDSLSTSAADISAKASMGALLGARGNSGVILSQILRGIAKGLESKERFTAIDFAVALQHASEAAYKSLAEPVEGTILTVIREAAERALQQARKGGNMKQTLRAATSQARLAVIRTPEMLPTLKEAGVVDAGGKGLFYVFQGMKNVIVQKINPVKGYKAVRRKAETAIQETVYGYDLQFLIEGENLPIRKIQDTISSLGESVLVVGDPSLVRVHIHTHDPQRVMDYCACQGKLKDIVNDNMDTQVEKFKNKGSRKTGSGRKTQLSNSMITP